MFNFKKSGLGNLLDFVSDSAGKQSGQPSLYRSTSQVANPFKIKDDFKMLLTDVETEGKKQGYQRAAKEYEVAFRRIEKEFKETKDLINNQKNDYGNEAYKYIEKLEKLEQQKESLKNQINSKAKDLSKKYGVSYDNIKNSISGSSSLLGEPGNINFLDIICSYKEKKLRQEEQKGYLEAKQLYEEKIKKLKNELIELKKKGNAEIQTLVKQISQVLDAIAEEEMKIAELKILL